MCVQVVEGDDTAPSTPAHQGIPTHSTSEPPGAPRKAKSRRTIALSTQAPVRKLDFDSPLENQSSADVGT